MRAKTIDEFCRCEPGTFKRFIQQQEEELRQQEENRKARIRAWLQKRREAGV